MDNLTVNEYTFWPAIGHEVSESLEATEPQGMQERNNI